MRIPVKGCRGQRREQPPRAQDCRGAERAGAECARISARVHEHRQQGRNAADGARGGLLRQALRPRLIATSLLAAACASGTASAPGPTGARGDRPAEQGKTAAPPQDLDLLISWIAGRHDNYRQVDLERDEQLPPEIVHEHVHAMFVPVPLPALGSRVLFEQQYRKGDPRAIGRQRVYAFSQGADRTIVTQVFELAEPGRFVDPAPSPQKLSRLTSADLRPLAGCELRWKRTQQYFEATTSPRTCKITGKDGKPVAFEETVRVYEDGLWFNERGTDTAGKKVLGHQYNIPMQFRRARVFTGRATIKNGGKDTEFITSRDVMIHDQGEKVPLVSEQGKPTGYELKLTEGIYSKANAPVIKLALYKQGSDQALGYVWANPDVERIGLVVGDVQVAIQR